MSVTTTNEGLQLALNGWKSAIDIAVSLPYGSEERNAAIRAFCLTFVPPDVNEEDSNAYADELSGDEEKFTGFVREMSQCATGERVTHIEGDQAFEAMFTLLPPEGTTSLDIVRELVFVSADGVKWTAEG